MGSGIAIGEGCGAAYPGGGAGAGAGIGMFEPISCVASLGYKSVKAVGPGAGPKDDDPWSVAVWTGE